MDVKKGVYIAAFSLVLLLLASSFASAGFFDWFKKSITGQATKYTNFSITVVGINPVKIYVNNSTLTSVTPTADGMTLLQFNVTVTDPDGASDINSSSVNASINYTTTFRINTTAAGTNTACKQLGTDGDTTRNFTCGVELWYFDPNGTWTINVTANDVGNTTYINQTNCTFDYGVVTGFEISPDWVFWPSLTPGDTNKTSLQNTTINNTGNAPIYPTNISINSTNLRGATDNTKFFDVANFTISWNNTASKVPPGACQPGNVTVNATDTNLTIANLTIGNHSLGTGVGQEILYYCILRVPQVPSQIYASNETGKYGAWKINGYT